MSDSQLQLKYVFTPDPYLIRASVSDANPNTIDLQIMVSNPDLAPAFIESISIKIPVGQEGAPTLSDSPDLPSPTFDTGSGWLVDSSASTLSLTPPTSGVKDSFLLTLTGIQVNLTPGVVPITIKETVSSAPKPDKDDKSYWLVKQPADFPITSFTATPSTLYDFDETVTLNWKCSDQGEELSYSLSANGKDLKNCVDGKDCYTCADGIAGVKSPPLQEETIFELKAIKFTQGVPVVTATLKTTVDIVVPQITYSYATDIVGGWMVRLHWLTKNAVHCEVRLDPDGDNEVIDPAAPPDTYTNGYPVMLKKPGPHKLVVTPISEKGVPGHESFTHAVETKAPVIFNTSLVAKVWKIVVSQDSTHAAMLSQKGAAIIDLKNLELKATIPSYDNAYQPDNFVFSPDSKLAVMTLNSKGEEDDSEMMVIDLSGNKPVVRSKIATKRNTIDDIAITPDNNFALTTDQSRQTITIIDLKKNSIATQLQLNEIPMKILITPDGKSALVARWADSLRVLDIENRSFKDPIKTGPDQIFLTKTPDGTLALAGNSSNLSVIDLKNLSVLHQVDCSNLNFNASIPCALDNSFAIATSADDSESLVIIDLKNFTLSHPFCQHIGDDLFAISPDGTLLLMGDLTIFNGPGLIDLVSRQEVQATIFPLLNCYSFSFTPDGKYLVASSGDGKVIVI